MSIFIYLFLIIIMLCFIYIYTKYGIDYLKKVYITKNTIHKSNMYNSNHKKLFFVCVFNLNDEKLIQSFLNKIIILHEQISYEIIYSNMSSYKKNNKLVNTILFDYDDKRISDEIINIAYYNVFHNYQIAEIKIQELKQDYQFYKYSKSKYIENICLLNNIPYLLNDDGNIQIGYGINQQNTNELFKSIYTSNELNSNILTNKGRIPIISVTGTNGKTTTTTLCAFILRGLYKNVGKITTTGVYINDHKIESGDCAGSRSAKKLLMNDSINACSFETALGGIRSSGLGYDYANVGILMNIGKGDHISSSCISKSIEDNIRVKMTVINYILPNGYAVINANDEHIDNILMKLIHQNIFLFSVSKQNIYIEQSIQQGKHVIYYDAPNIIYLHQTRQVIFNTLVIPILENAPLFQIENVMASIAASIVLNIPENIIKKQLSLYENTCVNNPGRMNRIKYGNTDIIIDYAHNTDSINNICNYVSNVKHKYTKKIIMFGAAGDRNETIIKDMTNTLYNTFDITILFVDDNTLRGKTSNELMEIMKRGISINSAMSSYTNDKKSKYHYSEKTAIDDSFSHTTKNSCDLLILLVDDVEISIKYIMEKFIEL